MRAFSLRPLSVAAILFLSAIIGFGQETDVKVIDEVVAQVNDGVITLSRVKREAKEVVDAGVQQGKDRAELQKEVDSKQDELIVGIINEELLMQRAKEAGLEAEIEAELNQRFLEIMKQYKLKTLDELYQEMEKTNVDPKTIRDMWRSQITKDVVVQREVQSVEYWKPNATELRAYFEKNKAKFTKPEMISFTEIFLNFAGRDENAVREKAKQLVAQLRAGGDYEKAVLENSDRQDAATTKGKIAPMVFNELNDIYKTALKDAKAGSISDPIEIDGVGINILKIDERTAASSDSHFDENAVRRAILAEKAPEAMKKFMADLRSDAYIKISDKYRPSVAPLLYKDERAAANEKTEDK